MDAFGGDGRCFVAIVWPISIFLAVFFSVAAAASPHCIRHFSLKMLSVLDAEASMSISTTRRLTSLLPAATDDVLQL